MLKIMSDGVGVNSTAIQLLGKQKKIDIDYIIFSDLGGELPDTYSYISVHRELADDIGAEFIILKPRPEDIADTLYDYCYKKKIFPFRRSRSCSDKWKSRPITKWIKENTDLDVVQYLGFDIGEVHRARESIELPMEYPLIENKMDRKACIRLIKKEGLSVPIKSGCFFCPFTRIKGWKFLYYKHPDLYEKAVELEENADQFPKNTITRMPLRELRKRWHGQGLQASIEYFDRSFSERCVLCHE